MTIKGLCKAAGMSTQAYYREKHQRVCHACDEELILDAVRQERRMMPRIGARKLVKLLGDGGITIGRDRLIELLRRRDMLVHPKKKKVRTTYRDDSLPVFRNLLYELEPTQPNQVWVSDLTYIAVDGEPVYLALVTDMVSKRIVGWNVSDSLCASGAVQALQRALQELPAGRWPIHHSDRGCQYCCHEYVAVLQERGLPISMTEQNHCYENCYAERVNGILKNEFNLDAVFRTREQAYRAIEQAIETYNSRRPHCSLGMRTPNEVHALAA